MMTYWPVQPVWQYPVLSWNSQHWVWSQGTVGWAPRPSSPSRWSASSWGTWCRRCGRSSYWRAILLKWNLKVHVSQIQLKVHYLKIYLVYHSVTDEVNWTNLISSTLLILLVAFFITSTLGWSNTITGGYSH